jgi:hypothetical protein
MLYVYAATGSAVWWVSFGRPLRGWAQGFKGVVGPFFGAVSVLFALQAGFLANDVVVRNREAETGGRAARRAEHTGAMRAGAQR